MIKKPITINLSTGLEARPVAQLVQVASQFNSEIYVEIGKKRVNAKSIMGMMVPKVEAEKIHTNMVDKGYGVISTSAYIEEAAAAFEKLLDTLVRAAEVETTMKKLLDEIEKTKRRVNALEFKIIPELKEAERFVKFSLEEMDRENTTRLKHLKRKGAAEE